MPALNCTRKVMYPPDPNYNKGYKIKMHVWAIFDLIMMIIRERMRKKKREIMANPTSLCSL